MFRKGFIPRVPKSAMGSVVFSTLTPIAKRGTDVPSNRSERQELVVKRSRSLFNLFGREWIRSSDLLRLGVNKSVFADRLFVTPR